MTVKTEAQLETAFADNSIGSIGADDMLDFIDTVFDTATIMGIIDGGTIATSLLFADDALATFGDGSDVTIGWDGTKLEVLPATNDTGAFNIGNGTTDMDFKWFAGSAYLEFNVGDGVIFTHLLSMEFSDDETLSFGAGYDLVLSSDGTDGTIDSTSGGDVNIGATSASGVNIGKAAGANSILGTLSLPNIPTSDPGVAGQVWLDTVTLKISAGT